MQPGTKVHLPSQKAAEKSQVEKARELARKIETVDSEEPLHAAIRTVAKSPPPKNEPTADKPKKAGT